MYNVTLHGRLGLACLGLLWACTTDRAPPAYFEPVDKPDSQSEADGAAEPDDSGSLEDAGSSMAKDGGGPSDGGAYLDIPGDKRITEIAIRELCSTLSPDRVYARVLMVAPGTEAVKSLIDLERPHLPCLGIAGGCTLGFDSRVACLSSEGVSEPRFAIPEKLDSGVWSYEKHWPTTKVLSATPCITQGVREIFADPTERDFVTVCRDQLTWVFSGALAPRPSGILIALGEQGSWLSRTGAGLLLTTPNLPAVEIETPTELALVGRRFGSGFLVVLQDLHDDGLRLVEVSREGVLTERGAYPHPGGVIYNHDSYDGVLLGRVALDASGAMYALQDTQGMPARILKYAVGAEEAVAILVADIYAKSTPAVPFPIWDIDLLITGL